MYKIAVYGKGGIGKSSISTNLSYLLSTRGLKVLHIGCDPKHDSTRLLTGGIPQKTFLDHLNDKGQDNVIVTGSNGVYCAECGGAEPGIGCAGKGLAAMLRYVEQNTPLDTDVRVCDVLGDVVCGGFSVPMRKGNADGIILVISEEFMSIYAANNILRGIRNLNGEKCVLGLVLNSRDPEDRSRAESFAQCTGLRFLGELSRSASFSNAERFGKTVSELYPESLSAKQLNHIVDNVCKAIVGEFEPVYANPLSDKAMMQIAAGQPVTDTEKPAVRKTVSFDTYDAERKVTYSGDMVMPACTSHGAVQLLLNLEDAAVILHGARNCAFLNEYAWRRSSYWQSFPSGHKGTCNLYSTGLDGETAFSGNSDILKKTIDKAVNDGFRHIFIVPTCASEIIGADIGRTVSEFSDTGIDVTAVPADPQFLSGRFGAYRGAASVLYNLVDWDRPQIPGTVSFLGLFLGFLQRKENTDYIDSILGAFGLRRGTSFVESASVEDVLSISESQYLLCSSGHMLNSIISDIVSVQREVNYVEPLVGMRGLRCWVDTLSAITGRSEEGSVFLEQEEKHYAGTISALRERSDGKKVLIYTRSEFDLDWHIDVLRDLGMEVVAIAHWSATVTGGNEPKSEYTEIPRIEDVGHCSLKKLADSLGVDIIVSGDSRTGRTGYCWVGPATNSLGRLGAEDWAGRVVRSLYLEPQCMWDGGYRK